MSTRIGLRYWVLAGLCLIQGCAEDAAKLTQIVVVVDSDLPVPDRLDNLQIEVSGTKKPHMFDQRVDTDQRKLPHSLGLVYSGGPLGPVRVVARGRLGDETVVERVAEVHFKRDRTLKLALALTRACAGKPACEAADETCEQGQCIPTAMSLPSFDGDDGPLFMDAGPWSPEGGAFDNDGSTPNAADGGSDAGPDGATSEPTCTIESPADGDKFYAGDEVSFDGSCVRPDGEPVEAQWRSSLTKKLPPGGTFANSKLAVGAHELTLCAKGSDACATTQIVVEALPELTATISMFAQQGSSDYNFKADAELVVSGQGTGVPPLELTWIDSFAGKVGSGTECTFTAPMLPGRHLLRLEVKDARGRTTHAERGFVVRAPGHSELFESYSVVNSVLSTYGMITALTSDGAFHYVGTDAGYVLQVVADLSDMAGPMVTPTGMTEPRPEPRGLFVHSSANRLYIATSKDVQSCDVTNGTVKSCAKLVLGNMAMAMPRCVRRLNNEGTDYLIVGTSAGLWVGAHNMLDKGTLRQTSDFNAIAESAGKLWFAGSNGLSGYTLGSGGLSGDPKNFPGASGGLQGMVASGDQAWSALSSGFTRYDASDDEWTVWTTRYADAQFGRLVHDDVRSIAITHPVIGGVAHNVIWIGTSAGLSRFDPGVNSFTTYSKADGLPDNAVLQIVGLPNNELLLATPAGLAIHRGQ